MGPRMAMESSQARFACKQHALAWLAVALAVAGCSVLDGGMGHRGSTAPEPSTPSKFEATIRSSCPQPVVVCYGTKEKCVTLGHGEQRAVRGPGAGLPVRLKNADASVSVDATFSIAEVAANCTSLVRQIAEQAPEPEGNGH
jgi:hypothetical protein